MSVLRGMLWAMAASGVAFAVSVYFSSVSTVSLSCSKTGAYDNGGSGVQCDDPITAVTGVWPIVSLGLILAAPSVVAALTMRRWVSWLAAVVYLALAFVGVAQWAEFWGRLLIAVPLAFSAMIIAIVHQVVHRADAKVAAM